LRTNEIHFSEPDIFFNYVYCYKDQLRADDYLLKQIKITDPQLSEIPDKSVLLNHSDEGFDQKVQLVITQHNWSDRLSIDIDFVRYSFQRGEGGLQLTIDYKAGESKIYYSDCFHVISCNNSIL